ncbi:MAG: hypothetical protein P1S60_10520, partial [Anaerolineae bacterium]|nr:hypothetical protein [Anaerolineae bacterium]
MIREQWSEVEISAYLDGQLAGERLVAFEHMLANDSALRQRVAALRNTIALLRDTPLRESPRNYLLTPEMVADSKPVTPPRRRTVGFMRLATSLTAAAFVLTMGLNVLTRGILPPAVMKQTEGLVEMENDEMTSQDLEKPIFMAAPVTLTK